MTYEEKLAAVVSKLDSDGADSEEEWAARILAAIGINPESDKTEVYPGMLTHPPRRQIGFTIDMNECKWR